MAKKSAGILVYRFQGDQAQVFLVHPGGPFWAKKDSGAWSIPKGEFDDEEPLAAAKREFREEIGVDINGQFIPLQPVTQKNGKVVHAWAVQGNVDSESIMSNTFAIEWPLKSGNMREFPEVDKAAWFSFEEGAIKINAAQAAFIRELQGVISKG